MLSLAELLPHAAPMILLSAYEEPTAEDSVTAFVDVGKASPFYEQALGGVPSDIGYVNAHGTATDLGDIAEGTAMASAFGTYRPPVSTIKSYTGHTLGACGAIESAMTVEMLNAGWFAPNLNLENPDPRCGEHDFITGSGRSFETEFAMSDNFAFGGVNTSLVFRRA